jgi:hypothetical protein
MRTAAPVKPFLRHPLLRRCKSGDMGIRRRRSALQERHDDRASEGKMVRKPNEASGLTGQWRDTDCRVDAHTAHLP